MTATRRYAIRQDDHEAWSIVDVFTGQPTEAVAEATSLHSQAEAADIADVMNTLDQERRDYLDRPRRR